MGRYGKMKETVPDRRPAIFVDLDGCIVIHNYNADTTPDIVIADSMEKLLQWRKNNYYIVLTTGRPKKHVKRILKIFKNEYGFCFDYIITNLPVGKRILINDTSSSGEIRSFSFAPERNVGVGAISL